MKIQRQGSFADVARQRLLTIILGGKRFTELHCSGIGGITRARLVVALNQLLIKNNVTHNLILMSLFARLSVLIFE